MSISTACITGYRDEGYCILPGLMPAGMLDGLRSLCDELVAGRDAAMAAVGQEVDSIHHRGRRYFITGAYRTSALLRSWLYGPEMQMVASALLGPDVHLFNDQFVVKGCDPETTFGWHQDSGYVPVPHQPYLSCWVALDDMGPHNGTISVLPFSRVDTRRPLGHRRDAVSNDLIGYEGADPGLRIDAPAGTVVAFSSLLLHRSGANASGRLRRALLCQYTPEPLLRPDGEPYMIAEPFLRANRPVSARLPACSPCCGGTGG